MINASFRHIYSLCSTPGQYPSTIIIIPPAFPSSLVKKMSRNLLSKSAGSTIAPVATNRLGKMMKSSAAQRTPNNSHNDGIDLITD
jgi:hypothetical protein